MNKWQSLIVGIFSLTAGVLYLFSAYLSGITGYFVVAGLMIVAGICWFVTFFRAKK